MKNEYYLILKAVLINKSEEEIDEITSIIAEGVDWFEIAGILLNHRLGGYFYNGLNLEQRKKVPKELRKALELLISAQKHNK